MNEASLTSATASRNPHLSGNTYTLVFFTVPWCAPAVPMITIFEETIRDLTRLHPGLELTGVVVDLDEEETNQQLNAAPPTVSADLLQSIDFVPMLVLIEGDALSGREVTRLVGQLPKLVIRHQLVSVLGLE